MVDPISLAVALGKLVIAIGLAVVTQYIAIRAFDWLTKDIDEMAELKKGNVAVAIMLGAVVLAVSTIISSGVAGLVIPLTLDPAEWLRLVFSLGTLVLAVILAIGGLFLAFAVFDKMTKGINEEMEIKKGNVAVAILMASVMLGIFFVIASGLPKF